jgi:hypothetical protein
VPVVTPTEEDKLGEIRYATLILRLVLDRRGHLKYGELIDATNGFDERFIEWRGMIRVLRVWLVNQAPLTPPP